MGSCARAACGAASSAAAATIDGRVRARLIGSPVQGGIETAIMETARLDGKAAAFPRPPRFLRASCGLPEQPCERTGQGDHGSERPPAPRDGFYERRLHLREDESVVVRLHRPTA